MTGVTSQVLDVFHCINSMAEVYLNHSYYVSAYYYDLGGFASQVRMLSVSNASGSLNFTYSQSLFCRDPDVYAVFTILVPEKLLL